MKYKIITPNDGYNGVTAGVPFANGVGYTDDENVMKDLRDNFGYAVEEVEEKAEAKKKAAPKASKK